MRVTTVDLIGSGRGVIGRGRSEIKRTRGQSGLALISRTVWQG